MPKIARQKAGTELGAKMLRNIASTMERERSRRGMSKREIAALCNIASPYYLQILECSANPSLLILSRIAENLQVPLQDLLLGKSPQREAANVASDLG